MSVNPDTKEPAKVFRILNDNTLVSNEAVFVDEGQGTTIQVSADLNGYRAYVAG